MNVELLRELTEAHGVPGQEELIRKIVYRELAPICDVSVDSMGNVICLKKGSGKNPKKLMIAAHMDEIGFVVKYIDDKGFLKINPLGGWDPRMMAAQRVFVHSEGGVLNGLLMIGTKPKHLLDASEMGKAPKVEDFFVDVGLSADDAKKKIRVGDMVTMNRTFQKMGDLYTCKAMDDRVAVFVMIEAMKKAKKHDVDVYGIATVQEEIGLRGASAAGAGLKPDICVAIDITLANDFPGIPPEWCVTKLGEGTAVKFMDSSLICHPKVVDHFRKLAEKHKIKYQMEILPMGGTDAGGVQRLHGGIPSFTLSIPTRYVHTVNETVHKDDVQASIDLMAKYIEDAQNGDYTYSLG
ncbi:M42 family metallopeptidase [Kamptonema cortianum]|nr:M42 family metallopeptidase [Geitlerinema splendidum]MDK3158723.1 M42 family metallopeptidase [Kamptonema cortianum]